MLGWTMLPNIVELIFRGLAIGGTIALFILLVMLYREYSITKAERDKWKRIASGTILSKTEKELKDSPISKITKEVKKL